jgi:hypothetical protein
MASPGPLQLFGDFGFVGGEDTAPDYLQNAQTCINFYPEVDQQNPKEVLALLGCPGLVQLVAPFGGGVPVSGSAIPTSSVIQLCEVSMSAPTWPTNIYTGGTQNCPIIVGVVPTVDVINRNYQGNSAVNAAGDGNVYHYSFSTGALNSTTAQSVAPSVYQNWQLYSDNFGATSKLSDASTVTRPAFIMATTDGNNILYKTGLNSLANITAFVSNTSASWPTGTFVYDFGHLLFNTAGFSGTDQIAGIYPCADFQHVLVVTRPSGGGTWKWAIINCLHGQEAVTQTGGISTGQAQGAFNATAATGGASCGIGTNNPTVGTSGTNPIACLQSDLQTLWVVFYNRDTNGGGSPNLAQFVALTINQSTLDLGVVAGLTVGSPSYQGTNAFPSSNAAVNANREIAIWADKGICAMICGQELTVWTFSSFTPANVWPSPSSITNLPVRGMWELPNDQTALAVIGNTCFLVTIATPAVGPPSPPSFATLQLTSVGTLLTTLGPVHIRDNNIGGYAVIVDGPYGYLYNIKTQAFSRITDPAFLGADTVAFIDGWWIFNQPGTQTFYTQAVQYGITFNASNFALKDSSADNLRAVFENKEQLWLIGDKTTEIWYDAGGQYFAFQRLVGTPIQAGCKAAHSVARFSSGGQDGLMWFGRSERGENVILRTKGFAVDTVSGPQFGDEVATYPVTSDAIAYTYQEDTHEFYVLTFPTQDVTWCYDSQSGLLHKRLSYDPYLQQFHRHRSNCFMNFQGMRIVGDYQCGSLYQLTRSVQTDAGWPLWARRRSPHIWDKGERGRVFMARLQVDFKPGVGNPSGNGSNPQAGLTISRDGGKTFGQRWPMPIGQIGQYKTRAMWRRLGFGRDNVVEIDVIDPVPRDIIGVTLKAFSS